MKLKRKRRHGWMPKDEPYFSLRANIEWRRRFYPAYAHLYLTEDYT